MLAGVKVLSIAKHNNVLRGYIRYNKIKGLKTKRVEQLGVRAWTTIDRVDEMNHRHTLARS